MTKTSLLITALLTIITSYTTTAKADEVVAVNPKYLFVPVGFDDNDDVGVVVDGYLQDTCYRLRPTLVQVDAAKKKIVVQPTAVVYPGPCMDVTVPFTSTVSLGHNVPVGNYTVTNMDGTLQERLEVTKSSSIGPDDYLYAPVDSAEVSKENGKLVATVKGRFTSNCLEMGAVNIITTGKTLQMLPIMKQMEKPAGGEVCKSVESSFEQKVAMPELAKGRYLLHVRSLNGQAVNVVFSK